MNKNMTALVSAFARAYHSKKSDVKIYDDTLAEKILTNREYESIKKNMTDGINFFYPSFCGTEGCLFAESIQYPLRKGP